MKFTYLYQSPVGTLRIVADESSITEIRYESGNIQDSIKSDSTDTSDRTGRHFGLIEEKTPLIAETIHQLDEYFAGTRKQFNLPLAPEGTEFQKRTWTALQDIPYGATCSYKDIAESIGCGKGCRAVGLANNRNPIVIVIPCHRVIGSNGKLVGYGGGLQVKEQLLRLEGVLLL